MDEAPGSVWRHVRIFGERFKVYFSSQAKSASDRHGQLSRPDPITVVVILEVLDVLQPVTHFIVIVALSHRIARLGIKA